ETPERVGRAGEALGKNSPGPIHIENRRHRARGPAAADVTHAAAARPRLFTSRDRPLQRLDAVLGNHVLRHPYLRADHDVGILGDGFRCCAYIRDVDVGELRDRERREPGIGDVYKRAEASTRLRHDEAAEGCEVVAPGIAGRHAGGRALVDDELVGRNPDRRAVRVDVGVEIDEARRDEFPRGVEHAQRTGRGNFRLKRLDYPIADPDVPPGPERLTWIEHLAALDYQIELVVGSHNGTRRTGKSGSPTNRTPGNQKIPSAPPLCLFPP